MTEQPSDPRKIPFNKNLPTVLFVIRDDGGCGFYRCLQPAVHMRTHGLFNSITDIIETTPEHIDQADIVIFQVLGTIKSLEAYSYAKAKGKMVLVESDDLLNAVFPSNPAYETWNPGQLVQYRSFEQIKGADGVIVSTPQLAREYYAYNKNVFIIPNYLASSKWKDLPRVKRPDGVIRIGWAGGNAHIEDLKMVSKVIERIVKEYDGKVKFESMGLTKHELADTFKLSRFDDICPACGFQGETVTYAGESLDNYPLVLASYGWDIAIAPILNNAFNNAKSDLKLKEYAAVGYPTVASNVTPYKEALERGCRVLLAETYEQWYNNIKSLIENPALREEMADANQAWVERYWIEDNVQHYAEAVKFFQSVTNHPHGNQHQDGHT